MPKLPPLSWREVLKRLETFGYKVIRQKGSHMRLKNFKTSESKPLTLPKHSVIGKGLLRKILRDAKIDAESFKRF